MVRNSVRSKGGHVLGRIEQGIHQARQTFPGKDDGPGNFLLFPIHLAAQEALRQMGRATSLLGLQRYTQRWKRSEAHQLLNVDLTTSELGFQERLPIRRHGVEKQLAIGCIN